MGMLSGRQLLLYRQMKMVNRRDMAKNLGISENEVTIYEYQLKPIPEELYKKWIDRLK